MKQSFSYYLFLLAIWIKGVKRNFKTDTVNFKKIRKDDVLCPLGKSFEQMILRTFKVLDTRITEMGSVRDSDKLLIFISGGAFISGPAQHHYDVARQIAKDTDNKICWGDIRRLPKIEY